MLLSPAVQDIAAERQRLRAQVAAAGTGGAPQQEPRPADLKEEEGPEAGSINLTGAADNALDAPILIVAQDVRHCSNNHFHASNGQVLIQFSHHCLLHCTAGVFCTKQSLLLPWRAPTSVRQL